MGVSAEHEVESGPFCLVIRLGAVRKQNCARITRDSPACSLEIVRPVKMRVVDSSDPERLASAFDPGVFVQQDADARLFQVRHDFQDVMVSEDGQCARSERARNTAQVVEAIMEISRRVIGEVPGDHRQIVRCAFDESDDGIGKPGDKIEMQIGQMEQSESIEGCRKAPQRLIPRGDAHIEAVVPSAHVETCSTEHARDETVHRNRAFYDKRPFALMDKAGTKVGLPVEAPTEVPRTEPFRKAA